MIKAGIIGGSGYTGGELIRLLQFHPKVSIDFVYSTTKDQEYIYETHEDLTPDFQLKFTQEINPEIDILFLCLGHGNSKAFLNKHIFSDKTKIIDLSNDFRLVDNAIHQDKSFIYGLPELNRATIKKADNIANPGCFATAIQLALLPLAKENMLINTVHTNATTGSTGAGASLSATSHFSWRNNNISWYKPFTHQHLGEIKQTIHQLQTNVPAIYMLPQRGNFSRGIFVTSYVECTETAESMYKLYKNVYNNTPFTHVTNRPLHLKQVINTNNCLIHLHKHENTLLITSIIDNLLKGASGQAIQNMNLMFDFDENLGLLLKANYS